VELDSSSFALGVLPRGHVIVASEAVRVLSAALATLPVAVELSQEDTLEDLSWPHPPPGRWEVERQPNGRPT
jgi:hypothetical protein